ncbi:hypothetical protein Patl1_35084 [Pistacia atlantica]|uniref:Uncharacterized protein n=1 Tax=Pistacia atlantica TaxID=434234 RepID=A0ACC0ZVP2_9ROSI|nr:hypothetical protein Patl1_35084 [Pistacia atlantica]
MASFTVINVLFVFLVVFSGSSNAHLSTNFYSKTCPKVLSTVKSVVQSAVAKERRMGASLVRLHFHDWEKTATPNNNSIRGFEVVDKIKSKVEQVCPGLGGPSWNVKLGRRDSKTASFSAANSGVIPPPSSTLTNLINRFQAKGLSAKDMVILSGSHTFGQARCTVFRDRIYNESNIDSSFAKARQANCPRASGSGDNKLAPLDLQTPTFFDNLYYKNLLNKKGLLHSDQVLFNGGSTDSLVTSYSKNPKAFSSDFAASMIKMGDISPLTGSNGEIRKNCRKPN